MPAKLTAAQASKLGIAAKRPHKYGAVATVCDGIRFASKAEAARYQELKILENAGIIVGLELQPKFTLYDNKGNAVGSYVADFAYWEHQAHALVYVVNEVKGYETALWLWKKRHFESQTGIKLTVIGGRKPKKRSKRK